jgi:UDP-N-acetylglucosamine 2-epimerase (non-hydrolysing)
MAVKKKVMVVFGTRPEAIKMAPVILQLKKKASYFETSIVVTAQHREMLDQILHAFGIISDQDLNIMSENQTLDQILSRAHSGVGKVLVDYKPDVVLVQGDTTTTMAAAVAVYHHQIKLGHVEAGLRSFDKYNPFPEEINRTITDSIADFAFAPTEISRANLIKAGVSEDKIFVTGNTVVDALKEISKETYSFEDKILDTIDFKDKKVILLTTHRRENYLSGEMKNIMSSLNTLIKKHLSLEIVFPLHLNPNVRKVVYEELKESPRIHLVEPLSYKDLVKVMKGCYLVLTDSGGIQEEAPTFGKPVLVLRKLTERPEGVNAGVAKLVGTDKNLIVNTVEELLRKSEYEKMAQSTNPYGDGLAASRIVQILQEQL